MENIMVLGEITNFDQNIRIPHPHPQIPKNWDAAWTFKKFSVGAQKTGNVNGLNRAAQHASSGGPLGLEP